VKLPFVRNNLSFRFFSGSNAWRRAPTYEFRLGANDLWAPLDTGAVLRFPSLHEGKYGLQVRLGGPRALPGPTMSFAFEILPPWHRSWPGYVFYGTCGFFAVVGITRWSSHLTRRRNRTLENIVRERTSELESTMKKLNEETRISATLAERDRLAAEIHDSVQQGLSGAILQLDTTLKRPKVVGDIRSRLNVVRNMVSYVRQEVQNAVWDLDSSLLEGNDLGEALRKLATFTASSTLVPTVAVTGTPIPLPRFTTHHLLRIAQEATANSVRHAHATEITIELTYAPDAVSLRVSDNGVGFRSDEAFNATGHFGLRGIRGRATKLDGDLIIQSSPGEGTTIQIQVPVRTDESILTHAQADRVY